MFHQESHTFYLGIKYYLIKYNYILCLYMQIIIIKSVIILLYKNIIFL